MFNWLRRRRLSENARKKMLLVHARAEEALVETHVANIIDLLETLGEEIDLDRGVDLYVEMMSLSETLAATVATRLLAALEEEANKPKSKKTGRYRNVFREPAR
jgi:hypothetical protein